MRLLPALGAAALAFAALPACAADVSAKAGYLLSLGGINIATAEVTFNDADGSYDLKLDAQVTGLANLVATGIADVESSGNSAGPALQPAKFDVLTRANGEDFRADVTYAHGEVTGFTVEPPLTNNFGRVPIERSQLTGVGDMLSAFVLKGSALDPSLCDHTFHIFTGVERFDLAMSYIRPDRATSLRTAYQGPVMQCHLQYLPISGHFTTSATTNYLAHSDQLYIWYAPMGGTGYYLPYRVLIATSVGDLSMVLTRLSEEGAAAPTIPAAR
jgi:Protein of unknown function (DUF3108)